MVVVIVMKKYEFLRGAGDSTNAVIDIQNLPWYDFTILCYKDGLLDQQTSIP